MSVLFRRMVMVCVRSPGGVGCRQLFPFSSESAKDKTSETDASTEKSSKSSPDFTSLRTLKKPSYVDKKILLAFKVYEDESQIPELIDTQHIYRKAKDKFMIVWYSGIMIFIALCYLFYSRIFKRKAEYYGDLMYQEQLTKDADHGRMNKSD